MIDDESKVYPSRTIKGEAFGDWLKEDIKRSASAKESLGKFFFGVSSASVGVVISIIKLSNSPEIDGAGALSLLLFAASAAVALWIARPEFITIRLEGDERTDLVRLHRKGLERLRTQLNIWVVVWAVGVFCTLGVRPNSSADANSEKLKKLSVDIESLSANVQDWQKTSQDLKAGIEEISSEIEAMRLKSDQPYSLPPP